jgi:hypothetical protein
VASAVAGTIGVVPGPRVDREIVVTRLETRVDVWMGQNRQDKTNRIEANRTNHAEYNPDKKDQTVTTQRPKD